MSENDTPNLPDVAKAAARLSRDDQDALLAALGAKRKTRPVGTEKPESVAAAQAEAEQRRLVELARTDPVKFNEEFDAMLDAEGRR